MKVQFSVLGEPKGKGRPRFTRMGAYARAYTPEDTATYENLIRLEYRRQCGDYRFEDDGPVEMQIDAYYMIPKSTSNRKRQQMLSAELRPMKKPDADNIIKVVADALNGIAYHDDTQIADCSVRKYYGETPQIIVCLRDIGNCS